MSPCPDLAELERMLVDPRAEAKLQELEQHLTACSRCRQRLDTIANVRDLLPEMPRAPSARPPSAALSQAMRELEQLGPADVSPQAFASAARPPFLEPTDQPGFIGTLGPYPIKRVIGHGGMGMVLEGFEPHLQRRIAIKALAPWMVGDREANERFLHEARVAAALVHENIVPIHAVAHANDLLYLVFEYVDGESLAERLQRDMKLPLEDVLRIGLQVARGLAEAHAKGIVHRDLKPANILLESASGKAKLADFGLAKKLGQQSLTLSGTVIGTPEFMSPEQACGKPGDERSDLFSLGVVMYVMASGISPFRGPSLLETLDNVRSCRPPSLSQVDPSLPGWFCELVDRLMSKEPQDRVAPAAEVVQVLERSLPHSSAGGPPHSALRSVGAKSAWPLSHAQTLGLAIPGGVAAVALLVALGIWLGGKPTPSPAPPPDKTANSQPAPPAMTEGFAIAGSDEVFPRLAEAIAAVEDGATIEVYGDGPYVTPPLSIEGKRLTIRAAPGSQPKFVPESPVVESSQGFLQTDSDLRLEGLEIHWSIASSPGLTEADILGRSIVVCTHGRLILTHCRFVTDRLNGCVAGSCRSVLIRDCHFLAKNGLGVFWRPEPGGGLDIENSILENRFGITLLMDRAPSLTPPGPLRLSHCALAASHGLQLLIESPPRMPLPVAADHTLLDCENLFVILVQRPRPKAAPKTEEIGSVLRLAITWLEEANVHRRGMEYLARPRVGRPGEVIPANVVGIDRWLEMWKLPGGTSIEADLRYQARTEGSKTGPLVLAGIDKPSGTPPDNFGARADKIGPGEPYHKWRASSQYAAWPPDEDEKK